MPLPGGLYIVCMSLLQPLNGCTSIIFIHFLNLFHLFSTVDVVNDLETEEIEKHLLVM